jgi:nitrogenase molybdenum-iron protein alpha/beta subunit
LCGVRVQATLCAGSRLEDLIGLRTASHSVMVHEECADAVAAWCESHLALPTLRPIRGAPIGFDRTEQWVCAVCEALGVSAEPARKAIDQTRIQAVMHIKRLNSLTGLPKGATFAIRAPASVALGLSEWLHDYLGMVPVAVVATDPDSPLRDALHESLAVRGKPDAANSEHLAEADCIFADGATLAACLEADAGRRGIEIALPSMGYVDVVDKCVLGAQGALHLLEWIVNALFDR